MLQFPSSGRSFQEVQAQLNEVAAGLNQSANEVVQSSRGTTQDLARATSKFGQDFSNFLEAGVDMAGTSQVGLTRTRTACVLTPGCWQDLCWLTLESLPVQGRPDSGGVQPEDHLHVLQQAAAGSQSLVHGPELPQPQEPAGHGCSVGPPAAASSLKQPPG